MKKVALLAEGVDRNKDWAWRRDTGDLSPSSRRAWIEIVRADNQKHGRQVALLAEGVDRNRDPASNIGLLQHVALLAEGVDRNLLEKYPQYPGMGRPPRGGRG